MKHFHIYQLKDKIIYNVLMYLEMEDKTSRLNIIEQLTEFGKYYGISIKKMPRMDTKKALLLFVINGNGYKETINKLYNSL